MRPGSVLFGMMAWLSFSGGARADRVADLSRQLETDSNYKVRLAAALTLGRLGDVRALPSLIRAVDDSDKTVRGVSAAAVGRLIGGNVGEDVWQGAKRALERASKQDKDAFVRSQATKALESFGKEATKAQARVYVQLGPMADGSGGGNAILRTFMRDKLGQAFSHNAPEMCTKWQGGKDPDAKDLKAAGTKGAFYLDGTLTALTVERSGSSAEISCDVSLVLASYPEKSMFGFIKGGASLSTGSSDKMISGGKEECIEAVLVDLVEKKVVPAIRQRVP